MDFRQEASLEVVSVRSRSLFGNRGAQVLVVEGSLRLLFVYRLNVGIVAVRLVQGAHEEPRQVIYLGCVGSLGFWLLVRYSSRGESSLNFSLSSSTFLRKAFTTLLGLLWWVL
jgi:hypothetical protein